jgi:hypothetical protein
MLLPLVQSYAAALDHKHVISEAGSTALRTVLPAHVFNRYHVLVLTAVVHFLRRLRVLVVVVIIEEIPVMIDLKVALVLALIGELSPVAS